MVENRWHIFDCSEKEVNTSYNLCESSKKEIPSSDWTVGKFWLNKILGKPNEGCNLQNKVAESSMLIKTSNVKQYMNLEDEPSHDIIIQIII